MAKKLHDNIYDKGLEQISNSTNWGGGVLKLAVVAGNPATATEASTLYPSGKRISAEVALVAGDVLLGARAGGGREITVAAKTPLAAATVVNADSGTATSGGAAVLTNSARAWTVNAHTGWVCAITGGTGAGQSKIITSNTATQLTVDANWTTPPDATSTYQIRPDINVAIYDGGGTPRLLSLVNESQDAEIANGSTLNIPSHKIGFAAP